jgi:hypothetical protein
MKNNKLIKILNEWDILGVMPNNGGPKDEYDVFADQIAKRMDEGISLAELESFLETEISSYFSLPINDTIKNNIKIYVAKILK